jgi:hypothetical protein
VLYGELFRIFIELSEYIDSVTFWGRADHQSWRAQGFPLLFDGSLEPKPAFWAIVEVGENAEPPTPRPDEPDDDDGFGDVEPEPMPEVPPLPDAPSVDAPNNNVPPWWAIVLMVVGVAAIGIALYILLKKK